MSLAVFLVLSEIGFGFLLWWVAVYLISQNPFHRLSQVLFGIFTIISFYFTSDLFFLKAGFYSPFGALQLARFIPLLKISTAGLYLLIPLLYQASFLLFPEKERKSWQKGFYG